GDGLGRGDRGAECAAARRAAAARKRTRAMKAVPIAIKAALIATLPLLAFAQQEMPAVGSNGKPATAPPPAETKSPGVGTTILGERESPIGLYITPWRNATAEKDIDRPARLL